MARPGDEAAVRFMVEVFFSAALFAMDLLTILNRCHHFSGFVYQHARFSPDKKAIEIAVRPRTGSTAVCSGCHQPAPVRYSRQIPSEASFRLPRNTARLVVISTRGITTRPIGPSNHYVYQRVRVFLRRRHNVSSLAFVLSHGLHGSERGGVNFIRCAARLVLRLTHSSGSLAF